MQIGDARVSRGDHQDLEAQRRTLRASACEIVFEEEASGAVHARPQLERALARMLSG